MTEISSERPGSLVGAAIPNLVLNEEFQVADAAAARFSAAVLDEQVPHLRAFSWPTDAETLDAFVQFARTTARVDIGHRIFVDLSELLGSSCLAYVRLQHGHLWACAAGFELETVEAARGALLTAFPRSAAGDAREVPVQFWASGRCGATSRSRFIAVGSWPEIAANYPPAVRAGLASLLEGKVTAGDAGQLILWHGPPGLGKTHVLRALAWEWRDWCDLHYVTDPEEFFGSADYMLDVLLDDDQEERWRLLVLEDTGELLTADAKERTGQGLSRFLNVVDGIVGQGLRILVLVTTNEPLKRLHPAVLRPGRCLARVEFVAFSCEEAAGWLEARGVMGVADPPGTLAGPVRDPGGWSFGQWSPSARSGLGGSERSLGRAAVAGTATSLRDTSRCQTRGHVRGGIRSPAKQDFFSGAWTRLGRSMPTR